MSTIEAKKFDGSFMKRASYISVLAIANLLLASVTGSMVAAGQGKNSPKQVAGGSKGTTNRNTQWSADPDRGWVHFDESQSTHPRHNSSTVPKQAGGKNKESGKGRKRF